LVSASDILDRSYQPAAAKKNKLAIDNQALRKPNKQLHDEVVQHTEHQTCD